MEHLPYLDPLSSLNPVYFYIVKRAVLVLEVLCSKTKEVRGLPLPRCLKKAVRGVEKREAKGGGKSPE